MFVSTIGYGLTETGPVTHIDCKPITIGSIGPLISNTEGKVCMFIFCFCLLVLLCFYDKGTQWVHDVYTTSHHRRCNVAGNVFPLPCMSNGFIMNEK